jgi:hypothetical protein
LVLAAAAPLAFAACASDNGPAGPDGGEDSGTGGKKMGTGGRTSTGGSSGSAAKGGTSGGGGAAGSGMCTMAVATECDGAEDCPSGQQCCGEYNGGYDKFSCKPSCAPSDAGAAAGLGMTFLFQLCHAGDTCEDSTAMCLTSPYLPMSFSRCLPAMLQGQTSGNPPDTSLGKGAHEVNCGSAVCGSDEECCIRQPLEPYCAPKGTTCSCDYKAPADAGMKGGKDAGGASSKDGGVPDAQAPSDSGSKHD